MRRITMLALVVVLALVGAACGGDDDASTGDDTGTTKDTTASDDGGDDGSSTDGGDLAAVIEGMGGCTGAAAAVSASMVAGFSPQAAQELEDNRSFFDDFESKVPNEIKDDVELFASYVDAYSDVLSDYTAKDFTDPEKVQEISDAYDKLSEDYPSDDLEAASQNISDWFTKECPALAGG